MYKAFVLATALIGAVNALPSVEPASRHPKPRNPKCAVWHKIREEIYPIFGNATDPVNNPDDPSVQGLCRPFAHRAVRMAFHDAIAYSPKLKAQGLPGGNGADGSFMMYDEELDRPHNLGIKIITDHYHPIAAKYNVSYGDIVHFGAALGLVQCPGAPRVPFFMGRPMPNEMPPDWLVPLPLLDVANHTRRFEDAGFTIPEWTALTGGGHSIGRWPARARNLPFDRTNGIFDTQFFLDIILPDDKNVTITRLQSDWLIAHDPTTACHWRQYINDPDRLIKDFVPPFIKLQLLGQDTKDFIDCSEAIPEAIPGPEVSVSFPECMGPEDLDLSGCDVPAKLPPTPKCQTSRH